MLIPLARSSDDWLAKASSSILKRSWALVADSAAHSLPALAQSTVSEAGGSIDYGQIGVLKRAG